jgi:tetratricopeptide (TPR) repeat protein
MSVFHQSFNSRTFPNFFLI